VLILLVLHSFCLILLLADAPVAAHNAVDLEPASPQARGLYRQRFAIVCRTLAAVFITLCTMLIGYPKSGNECSWALYEGMKCNAEEAKVSENIPSHKMCKKVADMLEGCSDSNAFKYKEGDWFQRMSKEGNVGFWLGVVACILYTAEAFVDWFG